MSEDAQGQDTDAGLYDIPDDLNTNIQMKIKWYS